MISRLTTYATLFAVLATATLAIATAAPAKHTAVAQLPTVVVIGHRLAADAQN